MPWQQAGVRWPDWGRGAARVSPRRPYKGTGRGGSSAVPRAEGPGICQVPGHARAPGRLVPTSPGRRPRPPRPLARPHPAALRPRPARPCLARPSLAGPRLPADPGSGLRPQPDGEGVVWPLQATPAPGRADGCLLPRAGCPYFLPGGLAHTSRKGWGALSFIHVVGARLLFSMGTTHHPEYLKGDHSLT